MLCVNDQVWCLLVAGAQEIPAPPSSPCVPSDAPHSPGSSPSLTFEGEDRSSGLHSSGLAGSCPPPQRKRWITGEARGEQLAWGAFSQALAGSLHKVILTSNKKGFQTQRKAQPGQCQAWLGIGMQKSKCSELPARPDHPGGSPDGPPPNSRNAKTPGAELLSWARSHS